MASKTISSVLMITLALAMAACSGLKGTSTSGSGGTGTGTTYTIGGTVNNLTGTGLVLQDVEVSGTDTLTITPNNGAAVPFTFKVPTTTYAVTVQTQPTNPAQVCTVSGGQGTATATVTTVAVTCTTSPVTATIGGTLSGLAAGDSVILEDNGGDALTLTANGSFTFKTAVTGPTDAYAVTVNTQPTTPNQICTVTNGSGTATANVTNVGVACVNSYSIGGNITGLVGSGLILQDQDGNILDLLKVTTGNGNQAFTFADFVPTGSSYTVSISTQPTNPTQTCVVTPSTATGTATANVTSVVVTCPAVTYSVGGTVVGLAGVPTSNGILTDGSFVLQNVLGNTLIATENGPFTFATPEALNDQYEISVFHPASTQVQGCTLWDYKGVVTGNVNSIIVDCAHNDWTWTNGTKVAGYDNSSSGPKPNYGSFPQSAPTTIPNPFTNTPGARYGAAGWTDSYGNLWLFGGQGYELSGATQPDNQSAPMNDLWVCTMWGGDYCDWQLVGAYSSAGAKIYGNAQQENQTGLETTVLMPWSRLGAAAWTDSAGNLWLFGGSATSGFMNDMWEFNASTFTGTNPTTYTNNAGAWTDKGGAYTFNAPGVYTGGSAAPGARVNAVTWKDASGNFWLFGGYGYDGASPATLGFLNDLWEYNSTTGTWTFVSGGTTNVANQKGNYGTQGTAALTNMPGARQEAVGWADANGNLWLFGGEGEDSVGTTNGILNDLWMYNIASNEWTWVTGSNMANQTGEYEEQPVVGPVNTTAAAGTCGLISGNTTLSCSAVSTTGAGPGSRWGGAGWIDAGGTLWLYGGWGLDSTATNGNGALNDLWAYTPNATAGQPGTWVWVKGSNTGAQNGVYGPMTRGYQTYEIWTPGGRSSATYWIQNGGAYGQQLWMFGGEGYDSTSTTGNGYLNDLWRYLPYQD
jgi:Galactose oxidase, central domain